MSAVLIIGVLVVVVAALGFATLPLWRAKNIKGRGLLAGAIALFLLGIGGGTYWMLGEPYLAWRATEGANTRDVNGLVALLIQRVRAAPNDLRAWTFLGRGYMAAGDADEAARAFARASAIAERTGQQNAALDSLYGEALVASANGVVTDKAEAAFHDALKRDPKDRASRFFLGQALAAKGDKAGALSFWYGLLADIPANSPLHQTLVDRIAMLTAASGKGAPDPKAMVAALAARLKAQPDDAAGWQRLIRAYTVLGERAKAQDALATARKAFAKDKNALAALDAEAKSLKLN